MKKSEAIQRLRARINEKDRLARYERPTPGQLVGVEQALRYERADKELEKMKVALHWVSEITELD